MTLLPWEGALVVLCVLAFFFDIGFKKIPNYITLPFIISGLVYHTAVGGLNGFWHSLGGLLAGTAMLLLPFAMGVMGGGDVKFLGAAGALLGARFVLGATVAAAVLGGFLALAYLLLRSRPGKAALRGARVLLTPFLKGLCRHLGRSAVPETGYSFFSCPAGDETRVYMPYGVPLALGSLFVMSGLAGRLFPGVLFWN